MLIGRAAAHLGDFDPTVDFNGANNDQVRSGLVCQARWKSDADGSKYISNNQGAYSSSYKVWLTAGLNSEVWIERTINSGTLSTDTIGSGRQVQTADREIGVLDAVATGSPTTANVTIDYWDAVSGGNNLATGTVTLSAERL